MIARAEKKPRPVRQAPGMLVGVMQLAWCYDMSRGWAAELLRRWEHEQQMGGPVRIMRIGKYVYTTRAVLHREMPPGRDLELYKRVEEVEERLDQAGSRIDRLSVEQADTRRRVEVLEKGRALRPLARAGT